MRSYFVYQHGVYRFLLFFLFELYSRGWSLDGSVALEIDHSYVFASAVRRIYKSRECARDAHQYLSDCWGKNNQYRSGSAGAVPILNHISLLFHFPYTIKGHFCRVFLNDKNPTEVDLRDLLCGRRIRGIK